MSDSLKIKDRDIVVPGETLAVGMGYLPGRGTYRDGDKLLAGMLGMVSVEGKVVKLISLSGKYIPKFNDRVIGTVIDVLMTGWRLDIGSAYSAVLNLKDATSEFIERGSDLTKIFDLGDNLMTQITNVTSQKLVDVTMKGPGLRKLRGGRIIEVNPHKVPRIIGKEGSMVSMIKQATGCNILVGQNGRVWLEGEADKEVIAVNAIRKIEEEAHHAGLTDRMKVYLEKVSGVKIMDKGEQQNGVQ